MKNESALIEIWEDFCREQKLPDVSADMIESIDLDGHRSPTEKEKEFATSFVRVWCYFQNNGF